jgi:hypothetical protein
MNEFPINTGDPGNPDDLAFGKEFYLFNTRYPDRGEPLDPEPKLGPDEIN